MNLWQQGLNRLASKVLCEIRQHRQIAMINLLVRWFISDMLGRVQSTYKSPYFLDSLSFVIIRRGVQYVALQVGFQPGL